MAASIKSTWAVMYTIETTFPSRQKIMKWLLCKYRFEFIWMTERQQDVVTKLNSLQPSQTTHCPALLCTELSMQHATKVKAWRLGPISRATARSLTCCSLPQPPVLEASHARQPELRSSGEVSRSFPSPPLHTTTNPAMLREGSTDPRRSTYRSHSV